MFRKGDKDKDATKNNDRTERNKIEEEPPPPPLPPPPPPVPSNLSPRSSRLSAKAFRRWSNKAQQQRLDKIAFMPETGVTEEMLELQERLGSVGHNANLVKEASLTDMVLAQKQQQALQKQHSIADKNNYDFLPRPFRAHMVEIKKRRMRKLVETMNSPIEVYTTSDKDKRVKFAPHGTLIFHILELTNLSVNDSSFVRSLPVSYYCVLSIGPLKRTSKIVHSKTAQRIRVDYTAHFSIEIPEWRESNLNRFIVELWSYQDPEMHYIVGSMEIHSYEFIRNQHAVERFQLWSDGIKVGKIYCEYAFSYGYFGYGHSNYLKNPNNPIMETACHSMYPRMRLDPDVDLLDKVYRVRMPEQLKVFTFNSLILEFGEAIELESKKKNRRLEDMPTKPIIVQQVAFEDGKPIHCKLHMNIYQKEVQPDFNDTFGEFICFGSRKTRLDFLSNLVSGRMKDLFENEAGVLFRPFSEHKDAEKIQAAEINHPGYLVYPTKLSCFNSLEPPTLSEEDETFQNNFPSLRRGQGYLHMLFGYEKKPPPSEFLNDMDAPLYKEAGIRNRRCNCCRWIRVMLLRIGAFLNRLFNFIFPEVRKPPPVPEISVTTPTPQGSTTKVYTYFAKESKDLGVSKLDKLQAQTAALIQLADHQSKGLGENSDKSSSSGSEEETIQTKTGDSLRKYHQIINAHTSRVGVQKAEPWKQEYRF